MKTIYIVRHGESTSNAGGAILGGEKTGLSEKGKEEAKMVAERCSRLPIEVIIASPYLRTTQTAELIAQRIQKPLEYSELFIEWDRGKMSLGKTVNDPALKERDAILFAHMHEPNWRLADEETFEDLNLRSRRALRYLESRDESNIALVGHGLFTRILVGKAIFGEDFTGRDCRHLLTSFVTRNTGLTVLRYGKPNSFAPWELITWNDHTHLG